MRLGLLAFALGLIAVNVEGCCLFSGCCYGGGGGCYSAPSKPAGGNCGWGGQCATSSCIGSGHGPVVIAGGSGKGHSGASFGGNYGGSCGGGRGGCGGCRGRR